MLKTLVIYTRVSTPKQELNYSLKLQLKECRKYAQEHGLEVFGEFKDAYTGSEQHRPEFDKVRALAGKVDVVLVYTLDRLARIPPFDFWNLCKSFQDKGTMVYTTEDNWIDADDFDQIRRILEKAEWAFQERLKIAKRTKNGRREAAQEKHKVTVTRLGKFGYDYLKKKRKLVINEEEAKIVKLIYDWYAVSGDPDKRGQKIATHAIARKLTQLGIPTKADRMGKPKKKGYGVWGSSSVGVILTDETYAGVWHYGRSKPGDTHNSRHKAEKENWIPVPVPAIVDRDTWQAAQVRARANYNSSPRNVKADYLMRQRLICSVCGKAFSATIDTRRKVPRQTYYCGGQRARGSLDGLTHSCTGDLSAEIVDAAVWRAVVHMLRNPDSIIDGLRDRQSQKEAELQPERESLERFNSQLKTLTDRRQWVLDAYLNGLHEKAWLEANLKEIEKTLEQLRDKIRDLEDRLTEVSLEMIRPETIQQYCEDASRGLDLLDFEHRRAVIDALEIRGAVCRGEEPKDLMISLSCLIPGLEIAAEFAPIPS